MYLFRSRSKFFWRVALLLFLVAILNINFIGRVLYPFPYQDIVLYYSRRYNIDPYLIAAIIKTESNFNPYAVSSQGAIGLMQIMPQTGKWVASEIGLSGFSPDQLYDTNFNICIGSWYVFDLNREFNGDTVLLLAAYNGGRGNVNKWLNQKNWSEIPDKIGQLPFPETRHFVRKVIWNYKIYTYLYRRQ